VDDGPAGFCDAAVGALLADSRDLGFGGWYFRADVVHSDKMSRGSGLIWGWKQYTLAGSNTAWMVLELETSKRWGSREQRSRTTSSRSCSLPVSEGGITEASYHPGMKA